MGLFGRKPNIPAGQKHLSQGENAIEKWSLRRLQRELDRIGRATEFNKSGRDRLTAAEKSITKAYGINTARGPRQAKGSGLFTGNIETGFGGVGRSGLVPSPFEAEIESLRDGDQEAGGAGFGVPSLASPNPFELAQETPRVPDSSGLFAEYDAARAEYEDAYGDLEALNTTENQLASPVSVGDEFYRSRLESSLAQRRQQLAAFKAAPTTQQRVDPSVIEARRRGKQSARAAAQPQRGGAPERLGPLVTTDTDTTGVL